MWIDGVLNSLSPRRLASGDMFSFDDLHCLV
jgi:hypothetical protein